MDSREINHQWYESFDEKSMTLTVPNYETDEMVELPAKFEVCSTCEGRGKHVNPSIDSRGLSAEDFAEDPDFAEDYFNGTYDVACVECKGKRVVPVLDTDRATPEQITLAEDATRAHYDEQAERWTERERGY